MTEAESQALYARRERFVDAFMASFMAGYAVLDPPRYLGPADALARALEAWDEIADTCGDRLMDAGLLPFGRVEP